MTKTVLIVDDSEFNLELIKAVITVDHDINFIDAHDGKEAVDKYEQYNPDLVILDIMMPYMGGVETLKIMKKINCEIPIIIITAVESENTLKACMDLGVEGYFIKPVISNKKLLQLVKKLLKL